MSEIKEISIPDSYSLEVGVDSCDQVYFCTSKDGEYVSYDKLDYEDRQVFLQIMLRACSMMTALEKQIREVNNKRRKLS